MSIRGTSLSKLSATGRLLLVVSALILLSALTPPSRGEGRAASGEKPVLAPTAEPLTFGQPTNLGPADSKPGSAEVVLALCYSPDGQALATAGEGRTVKLRDVATGKLLADFTGHTDVVTAVVFSPDGHILATAGYVQTVPPLYLDTNKGER